MSATEELRAMLDERGVEWTSKPTQPETTWVHNGWWHNARLEPWSESTLKVTVYDLTPAQAIAATLGRPTCRIEWRDDSHDTDAARGAGEI